jgi:hypothetical protein
LVPDIGPRIAAAVVPGTNILQLFYRGGDNGVWSRWREPNGHWSGEQGLGGDLATGAIAVAVVPQETEQGHHEVLALFYRGADNSLRSRWREPNGHWVDEQNLGGELTSNVTVATVAGSGILELFYRGTDNTLRCRWREPNGHWSDERNLGGELASDIVAFVSPENDVRLFYRGPDNGLRSRWREANGKPVRDVNGPWIAEQNFGGELTGDVSVAVVPGEDLWVNASYDGARPGQPQMFYSGREHALMTRWRQTNGEWVSERALPLFYKDEDRGGPITSNITAALYRKETAPYAGPRGTIERFFDVMQLFYRAPDNSLRCRKHHPGGKWERELNLGGELTSEITVAIVPGTDIPQLFYRGADNSVRSRWDFSGWGFWSAEQNLGGFLK